MADIISWVATAATIIAACMTASNLGSRITGYGFAVFTIGSLAWLATGVLGHQPALLWTNVALTGLNLFGIWRWLGRQASVDEGARAATEASEETPGEALFAVSLLSRAKVQFGSEAAAVAIDAMASCRSGRIAYVVVSEGGVAGIGETLRRLPWPLAHVEGEQVIADCNDLAGLEQLPRDEWPAR
jgi:hypothetical protein